STRPWAVLYYFFEVKNAEYWMASIGLTAAADRGSRGSAGERCRLPASLQPGKFSLAKDHVGLAFLDWDHAFPADVPATELAGFCLVIVNEYPLLAEAGLEVAVVVAAGRIRYRWRLAAVFRMIIADLEKGSLHDRF